MELEDALLIPLELEKIERHLRATPLVRLEILFWG